MELVRQTKARHLRCAVIRAIIERGQVCSRLVSQFIPYPKFCFIKLKTRKVLSLPLSSPEFMPVTRVYQPDLPTC